VSPTTSTSKTNAFILVTSMRLGAPVGLSQRADEHRPKDLVLLAVEQKLIEGPVLGFPQSVWLRGLHRVWPERKDRTVASSPTFGYARPEDGAYIGYRVDGDGPIDIVWQIDWPGNIDMEWEDPLAGPWLRELSSFARVITHDHRGVGVSSRNVELPTLETRVSDLVAVLRATGTRRPVLVGVNPSGGVHVLLAATRPALPSALVWLEPRARVTWAPDYPWGAPDDDLDLGREFIGLWGTDAWAKTHSEEQSAETPLPPEHIAHAAIQARNACTPDVAALLTEMWAATDVRGVLGAVKIPTLLLVHEEPTATAEEAEYIASQMPSAEVGRMPGLGWRVEEVPAWAERVRDFVGIEHPHPTFETVLSTVLFTDIVGSTERQAAGGDRAWRDLVRQHHAIVREALKHWRGVEIDTAGDGFYATFDGPARAVRCALDITQTVRGLGLEIRAGVHTGECELIDGKPSGLSVSTGARSAAEGGPSEVLVSQTVRDLVAGSGLTFEDTGDHELKGLPDRWRLYRVVTPAV
jgi:class 3 adenylate cyclase/pimeloyl-ACP methyl ester carboxylesterase